MKRIATVFFVVALAFITIPGCTPIQNGFTAAKAELAVIKADLAKIDWSAKAAWFTAAVNGLEKYAGEAVTILAVFDQKDAAALAPKVAEASSLLNAAKAGATTLADLINASKTGEVSVTDVKAAAEKLDSDYKKAATSVGELMDKTGVTATTVTTSSLPTQ